jgi:hypothetical protein
MFIKVFLSLYNLMDSTMYLLYIMCGFICNLSLLYVNPLFVLCEIYINLILNLYNIMNCACIICIVLL